MVSLYALRNQTSRGGLRGTFLLGVSAHKSAWLSLPQGSRDWERASPTVADRVHATPPRQLAPILGTQPSSAEIRGADTDRRVRQLAGAEWPVSLRLEGGRRPRPCRGLGKGAGGVPGPPVGCARGERAARRQALSLSTAPSELQPPGPGHAEGALGPWDPAVWLLRTGCPLLSRSKGRTSHGHVPISSLGDAPPPASKQTVGSVRLWEAPPSPLCLHVALRNVHGGPTGALTLK